MNDQWIDGLNVETFTFKSGEMNSNGVTLESIRLVEMISSLVNDKKVGEKASSKAAAAL